MISQVYKLYLSNVLDTEGFDLFGIWMCLTYDLKCLIIIKYDHLLRHVHMVDLLKLNEKCLSLTSVLKASSQQVSQKLFDTFLIFTRKSLSPCLFYKHLLFSFRDIVLEIWFCFTIISALYSYGLPG